MKRKDMMKKRHIKSSKSKWNSLRWEKLSVSIGNKENDEVDDTDYENGKNHYDNENGKFNFDDFDDSPGNDPGIFLGLEVVDGSQYEIQKKKLNDGGTLTQLLIHNTGTTSTTDDSCNDDKVVDDGVDDNDGHTQQNPNRNNSSQDLKEEKSLSTLPEGNGNTTDKSEKNLTRKERRIQRMKAKRLDAKMKRKRKREELQQQQQQQEAKGQSLHNENKNKEKSTPLQKQHAIQSEDHNDNTSSSSLKPENVQMNWSVSAGGIWLHPTLCAGLAAQNFSSPTPIQASTLPASILGQRDIVGAAPTGSGKTLAYALPILHTILSTNHDHDENNDSKNKVLRALVLCPTRELAMQVTNEFDVVCQNKVGCNFIVGGLSEHKQKRILRVKRPPILVATPGRLWELVSSIPLIYLLLLLCLFSIQNVQSQHERRILLVFIMFISIIRSMKSK